MAFTVEQLAKLEAAIAEGVLQVKYADKMVTYQYTSAMLLLRDTMIRDLTPRASRRKLAVHNKGLGQHQANSNDTPFIYVDGT